MNETLPDNNTQINLKTFVLDPLSVIIKLAIIGNKPVGTKILIINNIIYLQEPGPFQALCRVFFKTNKTDLQYMYNPIEIACKQFLSKEFVKTTPRIKNLFVCAQNGIRRLIETYKTNSIICLTLNYFNVIITNHVEQTYNETIFNKDGMTSLYTKELNEQLFNYWAQEKIKVVLDLIAFLTNDKSAASNVKSLENIMETNDIELFKILDC
uniref:Uncharacterized protein n=1 Tax=viral metagenome TaxID=1070528 RepID=A0A6C0IIW4_9ZZZZ